MEKSDESFDDSFFEQEEEKLAAGTPGNYSPSNHKNRFETLVADSDPDYFQHIFANNGSKLASDYKKGIQDLDKITHSAAYLKFRAHMNEDAENYMKSEKMLESILGTYLKFK